MAEQLDLTTPTPATPGRNNYRVDSLNLLWRQRRIEIWLLADNGERLEHVYDGQEATDLMVVLNKADLTTNSLHNRILARLVSDGVLDGVVGGAPD